MENAIRNYTTFELDENFFMQDAPAYEEDRAYVESRIDRNGFISCMTI